MVKLHICEMRSICQILKYKEITMKKTFCIHIISKYIIVSICIFILFTIQACSKTTKLKEGYAEVTIDIAYNLKADIIPTVGVYLIDNNINRIVADGKWSTPNNTVILYPEVKYGTYTLEIGIDWVLEKIKIDKQIINYEAYIDFENIGHKILTITNNTGMSLKTLSFFTPNRSSSRNLFQSIIHHGDSHNVIYLVGMPNLMSVRASDTLENVYTIYDFCAITNDTVLVLDTDIDGEELKDYSELQDWNKFVVSIMPSKENYVIVRKKILFESFDLYINGESIDLKKTSSLGYFSFHQGDYNFMPNSTYYIEIKTKNPDMSEAAYLTVVPDMILDFPLNINDNKFDLNWSFQPENILNPRRVFFNISSRYNLANMGISSFDQILPPESRNYSFPSGFFYSPSTDYIRLHFAIDNFTTSGQVSFISSESHTLFY